MFFSEHWIANENATSLLMLGKGFMCGYLLQTANLDLVDARLGCNRLSGLLGSQFLQPINRIFQVASVLLRGYGAEDKVLPICFGITRISKYDGPTEGLPLWPWTARM